MSERVFMMDCGDGLRRADNGCLGKNATAKTASWTLTKHDTGRMFTNTGAAAGIVATLPTAVKNLWFLFAAPNTSYSLTVTAAGTAKIDGGAAAGSIVVPPGAVVLVACDGTDWFTISTFSEHAIQYAEVEIASAAITGTSAGQLGHANGVELVAPPGAGKVLELVSAVLMYDYATAAYTGGGNVTVNIGSGGAALTGIISAANSIGASADKIVMFVPLAAAAANLTANVGLNLVAASAFTQPGTAAGVVRVKVAYRVHTTGL